MTTLRYHKDERIHLLTLDGHANYGEAGADIVCAGISAISYTLMGYLENLKAEKVWAMYRTDEGSVAIECMRHPKADTAFDMAMIGYAQIANKYPDNLSINISVIDGDSREQTLNN